MKTAFIVKTRDGKPFMVVSSSDTGTTFKPISDDAKNLAKAFADEYKDAPISKVELSAALDEGMQVAGPMPLSSLPSMLKQAEEDAKKYEEGTKPPKLEKMLPVVSVSDSPLSFFNETELKHVIAYKANAFMIEQHKTTFNYEVKRVRAMWDPTLSIPGTNRRGGWRCPTGTRYGGQITDRFGRNCGWGVARRLANAITNIGERLESVDDRRRGRRVNRRNEQMAARLRGDAQPGRIERGLRGVAERLEAEQTPETPQAPRRPQPQRRRGQNARRVTPTEVEVVPAAPQRRRPRRGADTEALADRRDEGLRESERRRVRREIEQPGAMRTEENAPPQAPARPRRQRRVQASEQRAERTATQRPKPDAQPDAGAQPKKPVRRVRKQPLLAPIGENGAGANVTRLREFARDLPITDEARARLIEKINRDEMDLVRLDEIIPDQVADYTPNQIAMVTQQIDRRERGMQSAKDSREALLRRLNEVLNELDREDNDFRRNQVAILAEQIVTSNLEYERDRMWADNLKRRRNRLVEQRDREKENARNAPAKNRAPEPVAPQPEAQPEPPAQRVEAPQQDNANVFVERATRGVVRLDIKKELADGVQAKINAEQNPMVRAKLQDRWDLVRVQADQRLVAHELMNWRTIVSQRSPISDSAQMNIRRRASLIAFRDKQDAENQLAAQRNLLEQKLGANDVLVALNNSNEYDEIQKLMINVVSLDNALKNWDSDSAMFERVNGAKPNYFDPNAEGAQQKREALGDLGEKIKNEISDAVNKRQGILGKYVESRYGKNGGAWREMTPERWNTLPEAEKIQYIKDAYSHDKIVGTNGKLYRFNASVSGYRNTFRVNVDVSEIDANGNVIRMNVGRSSREIDMSGKSVYNASFFIERQSDRGAGLQTIYNQHAFMYLNQVGVKQARVTAVDDGAFVWARIGYKRGAPSVQPFQQALLNYSKFGPGGLISNDEEYWRVRYLVDKANAGGRVTHQDYIFAVASSTVDRTQRYMREEQIKQWFKGNAPFGGGILKFSDQRVSPNPGQNPPTARRRRAPRRVASRV